MNTNTVVPAFNIQAVTWQVSPDGRDEHAGVEGSVLHGRNVSGHLLIIKTCTCTIVISLSYYKISKKKL